MCGGAVFHWIEFEINEAEVREQERHLAEVKAYFNHNETVLAYLQKHYIVFDERTFSHRWYYSSSIFFAFTLFTTIGYGRTSPSTVLGQAAVIVFR